MEKIRSSQQSELKTTKFFIILCRMVPESPRWLVMKGRFDEALKILKTGAKMNKKTLPSDNEMIEMMEKIKLQDEQDAPPEEEVKSMKERVSMTKI